MSMGVETLISVEEYLGTSYDPDMEYVDGVVVERNVGEYLHSLVQGNVVFALRQKYPRIKVLPELRSKVKETRYRVPDVCVLLSNPGTKILLTAAFIAVEILSEEDRMSRTIEKLKEYAAIGTTNIWLFDPRLKQMSTFRSGDLHEVTAEVIATEDPRLELTRDEVFGE